MRILPIEKHFIHRIDYRHFNTMFFGKVSHRPGGCNSLGHHPHFLEDIVEFSPLPHLFSHISVPTVPTHARHYQITDSRKACEGSGLGPEFDTEARDLIHPACHNGRLGIVTKPCLSSLST